MAAVRGLLARVSRLERGGAPVLSRFEAAAGGLDGWEAECRSGIADGHLDGTDVPVVIMAVRRWHRDGAWAHFQ